MQLQEYLKTKGLTPAAFARMLNTSRSTVHRYLKKPGTPAARMPTPGQMRKITKLTGGRVRPDDFYPGLHPRPKLRKPK